MFQVPWSPPHETLRMKSQQGTAVRPLLLDNVASIQQSAALALGRLANFNSALAESAGAPNFVAGPGAAHGCIGLTARVQRVAHLF